MEDRYAEALAAAICADLVENPPAGALSRVVIRWFEGPLYLMIHALGTDGEEDLEDYDAWSPLEWGNADEEIDRADRIVSRPAVTAAGAALAAPLEEGTWPWEPSTPPSPLVAAAQLLRGLCEQSELTLAPHFAVGVAHFEGWGAGASVLAANPKEVWDLLVEHGLDPGPDD